MKSALYTCQKTESTIDFEGRIALVFFTQGCNFRCRYCHNPELIPMKEENMSFTDLGALLDKARENWVDGVCITGGEPALQEALPETLVYIRQKGMYIKLDTQGSFPAMLGKVIPLCDYVAMDYKLPAGKYSAITGVQINKECLAASLDLLKSSGIAYEIRTTIVPGFHTKDDMRSICYELEGHRKYVLQTFVPRETLPGKELRETEKTPRALLEEFADLCRPFFEEVVIR